MSSESLSQNYKSQICPRVIRFSRPGYSHHPITRHTSMLVLRQHAPSVNTKPNNRVVLDFLHNRSDERRQLANLNDKFASYAERVHFLDVLNKKLQLELEALKRKVGDQPHEIAKMYEIEIDEAQKLINQTNKEREDSEKAANSSKDDVDNAKNKYQDFLNNRKADKDRIEELNKQIVENEAEISLLNRKLKEIIDEQNDCKSITQRLIGEIQKVTTELDTETVQRIQLENEKILLENELNFISQMFQNELHDLKEKAFKDPGVDPSLFFKSELATALKDLRRELDNKNERIRTEFISKFQIVNKQANFKPPEPSENVIIREEKRKLQTIISDQRKKMNDLKAKNADLEARIKELEDIIKDDEKRGGDLINSKANEIEELKKRKKELMDNYNELVKTNNDLKDEIDRYRDLLEGEGDSLKNAIQDVY